MKMFARQPRALLEGEGHGHKISRNLIDWLLPRIIKDTDSPPVGPGVSEGLFPSESHLAMRCLTVQSKKVLLSSNLKQA